MVVGQQVGERVQDQAARAAPDVRDGQAMSGPQSKPNSAEAHPVSVGPGAAHVVARAAGAAATVLPAAAAAAVLPAAGVPAAAARRAAVGPAGVPLSR